MGILRKFVYRFLGIEEEEESKDLLSSNFHTRSQLAPPLSAICSGNLRSSNDGLNNSDWNAEKKKATGKFSDTATKIVFSAESSASKEKLIDPKKQPSVDFSDTSTKKVLSGDSSASKEKHIYLQKHEASVHLSDTTIKNDISSSSASKETLRYPLKESTKPDSMLMESKKIASESHDALSNSSCNNQNKHLTVEQSTSSHSDSLRCNSVEQLDNNTVSRYLTNWEIFLTKVAAHLESLEEHEPRYAQISNESHTGPQDKVRTSSTTLKAVERKIQDYCSSQKILLVGEGDFSFSACLAKAFGSAANMVATSLDSKAYLKRHYRNAMDNISQLRMRGCKVFHGVDATNMEKEWRIEGLLFDRIIYNFPHSGDFRKTEQAICGNKLLIKQFMENAVKMIEEDGEIHIRHKSNWHFLRLTRLASEAGGLVLIEEAPFDPCEFSGYNAKYGFGSDKNFNCHPSCTYKFVLSKRQKKLRRKNNMLNDEPSNSHCGAEKTQASVCFSDTAVNKLISDDVPSYSECDYTDDSSNEIAICLLPKGVTEPDSQPKESEIFEEIISEEVELNPGHHQSEFDAALTDHESRHVLNFPERRSEPPDEASTSSEMLNAVERRIQDYCSSQKILLVGEGDFSFSACLAKAFGSATNIVATSLDSKAYLKRHYRNAMDNISQLRMRGCKVFHGVDATNMEKEWRIEGFLFDRIIYNFPHSGDCRNMEDALCGNKLLIKQFMENAVKMIEEDGEIHIRHKSNWYFLRWNLRGLASEAGGLVLIEEAPFDPCEFSGYNAKYGFGSDKNFNCHPSCTYKFVLSKRQKKLRRKNNMLNDEPSNSHCGVVKTQASVCFSDTEVNKLISDDVPSWSECDYTNDSSNEIVTCLLPKAVTEPDSQPKESEIFEEISEEVDLNPGHLQSEFDAALTNQEPRLVPNFPEGCTEPPDKAGTSSITPNTVEKRIQDYCSSQKILLVGEGDFSFSACLAKSFGSATNMVATSLDSKAYVKRHYRNAMDNISQLRMRGCKVFHGVDATNMEKEWRIEGLLFDRIIYNFPHSGDFSNTEDALWGNQLLIKQFMENAVKRIEEDGEIHIRHKSNWHFLRWNLKGLASEAGGLVLIEEATFDPCEFSGYNTKYGFEGRIDKNFNCRPSCTYKFVLSKRRKKLRRKNNMLLNA